MKVLQINAVNKIASTGRTSQEMSDFLIEKGESSVVAFSQGPFENSDNEFVIGNIFDTKIHGLLSRISGRQGYFSHLSTKKLLRFMDDYKPDVVVLRNLHGNYINLPMLLKYLAEKQIPTVITLHDFWFVTGKCVYFTSSGCEKWQDKCGNCSNLQSGNPTWFFDRTEEMLADKIKYFSKINKLALIGVSDWVTREAKKSPVAKSAVLVKRIYNWIDLNKFRPCNTEQLRKSRGLEDKFVILGVSSVWTKKSVVDKGLRSFIKLAKMLPENYRIVLVGKMDADVSLPENIISVGKTDSVEELAQYYSMADVFVTFSAEETFGKVSAEALACGTPIVCYNSTANPELVGNGCGAVLPLGDIEGIYSEIRKIALNGKANYSEACRTFAKESFDKEKNLNQYFELFKWLTEK